jgi:putative oxidoreductase
MSELIAHYSTDSSQTLRLHQGPENFVNIVQAIGTPSPHVMAWLTILVELFGGLAIPLGAFVAFASVPMAAVLLVAIFTVHLQFGFTSIKLMVLPAAGPKFGPPGVETDLLYVACLAALVLSGSGPLAVDAWIARRRQVYREGDALFHRGRLRL